jgi:hypothetical protein
MSTKSAIVVFAITTLVAPAFGDVPDGRGGRTAPQAKATPIVFTPGYGCCHKAIVRPHLQAAGPADTKALAHLAWVARANDPVPATGCTKRIASERVAYGFAPEVKALGHVAARVAAAPVAATGTRAACCGTASCPMRSAS